MPALDGANAGAVSQMAGNNIQSPEWCLQVLGCLQRDIFVGVAVKTEFSDSVGEVLVRETVNRRLLRNRAVERSVENGHMRHVRQRLLTGVDTGQHCGMMKRHQRDEPPYFVDHIPVNNYGAVIQRTAVPDAVRNGVYFRQAFDRCAFHAGYGFQNIVQRRQVIRDFNLRHICFAAAGAGRIGSLHADARHGAAQDRCLRV